MSGQVISGRRWVGAGRGAVATVKEGDGARNFSWTRWSLSVVLGRGDGELAHVRRNSAGACALIDRRAPASETIRFKDIAGLAPSRTQIECSTRWNLRARRRLQHDKSFLAGASLGRADRRAAGAPHLDLCAPAIIELLRPAACFSRSDQKKIQIVGAGQTITKHGKLWNESRALRDFLGAAMWEHRPGDSTGEWPARLSRDRESVFFTEKSFYWGWFPQWWKRERATGGAPDRCGAYRGLGCEGMGVVHSWQKCTRSRQAGFSNFSLLHVSYWERLICATNGPNYKLSSLSEIRVLSWFDINLCFLVHLAFPRSNEIRNEHVRSQLIMEWRFDEWLIELLFEIESVYRQVNSVHIQLQLLESPDSLSFRKTHWYLIHVSDVIMCVFSIYSNFKV
jgi:hypothetical protein